MAKKEKPSAPPSPPPPINWLMWSRNMHNLPVALLSFKVCASHSKKYSPNAFPSLSQFVFHGYSFFSFSFALSETGCLISSMNSCDGPMAKCQLQNAGSAFKSRTVTILQNEEIWNEGQHTPIY